MRHSDHFAEHIEAIDVYKNSRFLKILWATYIMSTKKLEDTLTMTKLTLLFSGIKMEASRSHLTYKLLFIFNFLWLNTDVIGEFYWIIEGVQLGKSFLELSYMAPCATICLLSTAKSLPFFFHQDTFIQVFEKLKEIHPKPIEDEELNEMIEKNVKRSIKFLTTTIRIYLLTCTVVVLAFCSLPLSAMAYTYMTTGTSEVIFPFKVKYFFDPYTKATWPFVYFHQVWSTFLAFTNVFGTDTFLFAFCVYSKMHATILHRRFQNAIDSWSQGPEESRRKFVDIIKRHQELIELVDQVEILYSKSTLFNIVSSSVLICLSGFNVTSLADPGVIISFLAFLFMSLTQIFLLCYFGDMLMRSSIEMSEGIYNSAWYQVDQSMKRNVLFVLIRTQKPCKLTAAKFADVNLRAFTTIMSRSWSYFALLKTVYK